MALTPFLWRRPALVGSPLFQKRYAGAQITWRSIDGFEQETSAV
jgi:hypothetical protein